MPKEKNLKDFKNHLANNLDAKFPGFEKEWYNIVRLLGNDFVNSMKGQFQDELSMFKEISQFRFSIVIDNNFIFGQIKNVVEKNLDIEDSFVYKLVNSANTNIYGPYKLKEELYDKLLTVLSVNNELAKSYADLLIEKIIIKDAQWTNEWKKANNLIGHIDQDDVPYLALAFHQESHAIISNDKIFSKQGASKTWDIQDADKIITSYNSGFMSFCFIGTGISIMDLIWKTFVSIFKVIGEILLEIISGIGMLVVGTIDILVNTVPPWLSLSLLALGIGAAILSEDFREVSKEILVETGKIAKKIIVKIEKTLAWLIEVVQELWEVFKPLGITSLEFAGYFLLEYELMSIEVAKLDDERAK